MSIPEEFNSIDQDLALVIQVKLESQPFRTVHPSIVCDACDGYPEYGDPENLSFIFLRLKSPFGFSLYPTFMGPLFYPTGHTIGVLCGDCAEMGLIANMISAFGEGWIMKRNALAAKN